MDPPQCTQPPYCPQVDFPCGCRDVFERGSWQTYLVMTVCGIALVAALYTVYQVYKVWIWDPKRETKDEGSHDPIWKPGFWKRDFRRQLLIFWIVLPSVWFFCEYYFMFKYYGNSGTFEQFKYGQDAASKIWVAFVSLLTAGTFLTPPIKRTGNGNLVGLPVDLLLSLHFA